jgi:hypothetical protein
MTERKTRATTKANTGSFPLQGQDDDEKHATAKQENNSKSS